MQGLYEFKGSDIRFLTLAQDLWQGFSLLQTQDFENCTLKMSYRITNEMAAYVNDVMLGEQRVNACRAGPTVYYMRDSTRNLQILVSCRIKELIQQGVPPSDIFVLGASVKGENSQIRKIENVLTNAHIPCYVPMMEDAKIDEKVIEGKVVFLLTILERRVRDSSLVCANGVGGQRCVPLCIVNSSCTHI